MIGDSTPPTLDCASTTADRLWHGANVSVHCTATDSGSGLRNPAAAFSLTKVGNVLRRRRVRRVLDAATGFVPVAPAL